MKRLFDAESRSGKPSVACWELSRSRTALCAGDLPRSRTGVEDDLFGAQPDRLGPVGAVAQKSRDVGDEIVVMRIGIGDARAQADVGGDDGRVVLGRDPQIVGVAEPRDVVADDGAGAHAASSTDARHVSIDSGTSNRARNASTAGTTDRAPRARPPRAPVRPSLPRRRGDRRPRRRAPRPVARTRRSPRWHPGRRTSRASGSGFPSPRSGAARRRRAHRDAVSETALSARRQASDAARREE